MSESCVITPADMGFEPMSGAEATLPSLEEVRAGAERQAILAALSRCQGDTKAAAEILQVSRATLYRLMEKYGIPTAIHAVGSDDASSDADDAA
jgi:DNA-binding NtrC family response regulator